MRKPHFEIKFQSDKRTDLFICLHIMFQILFQNSKGQKSYRKFLGVRSELLLSILVSVGHPDLLRNDSVDNPKAVKNVYYSKFDKDQTFIFVSRWSCLSDTKHFMINM